MRKRIMIIICTIVILCVSSVVSAATSLKDIKNTKYEDSVDTLITLGLVSGYPEDNTYRPEKAVTRAEMAKLMVVALGQESKVTAAGNKTTKFKDMKGHWAYAYVNLASELGVINGYPNGNFGPNNTVSYAEATAMILRALEYEDVVSKSKESWPNNYINQAKKLSLYSSVGTVNSNDGAKRGNVAIMLWNMLRTGVASPVGQNSSGVIYGEGEKLLNKKMTKFTYFSDVLIDSINFDDDYETATIKLKGDKTVTVTMDAGEAAKMYGQKYNILYNNTTKKIIKSEKTSNNTTKQGFIEKVTSSKIYIDGGSSRGYDLPKSSRILLYGVDSIDEAVEAILVFSGSSVEYIVAFPPEQVHLGIVTESDVSISKKNDGIKVANYKTSSSKTYPMADEDDMPDEDDIILYYLNSDNEVIILKSASIDDSEVVATVSKSRITLDDKTRIDLDSSCQIAKVYKSTLRSMSYSDISEDDDSAVVFEFGGTTYIVVFVDGADDAGDSTASLKKYQTDLKDLMNDAYDVNEERYTQATYANLMTALSKAESVKNSSTKWKNATEVKKAYNTLKSAYDGLKKATTTSEKEIAKAKAALRALVDSKEVTDAVKNKSSYVASTYNTFYSALSSANTLLAKTNATKSSVDSAKTKLSSALKGLTKTTANADKEKAIAELKVALADADKVGAKENYTEASYGVFKSMWDAAKAINDNTKSATIEQIQKATKDLNNAIAVLEGNSEKEYAELLILLKDAAKITNDDYFDAEYTKFETARNNADKLTEKSKASDIKTARANLEKAIDDMNKNKISNVLKSAKTSAEDYKNATDVSAALNLPETTRAERITKIEEINDAVTIEKGNVTKKKKELSAKIEVAKIEAEKTDEYTTEGIKALKTAITKAENVLNKAKVTSDELSTAVDELDTALEDFKNTKKPTSQSGDNQNQ